MKIDPGRAEMIFRDAADGEEDADEEWTAKIEELSRLCQEANILTHIAFLGTSILAKSVDRNVDLRAIKPKHSEGNPRAYSARSLCNTLVPLSAELGIHLGVTGREPLNNQPYFRMTRLGDGTPVRSSGRPAFEYTMALVDELSAMATEAEARLALRAFITVRRRYQPRYVDPAAGVALSLSEMIAAVEAFVTESSEGGRRAQAVVAGFADVFAGPGRVESGRINDPDRHFPGDVGIRSTGDPELFEKGIEVRDKPVTAADVYIFGKKCIDRGVREAAIIVVAQGQEELDTNELQAWAEEFGIGLTLFSGWAEFIQQALYWSELPTPIGIQRAVRFIYDRLIAIEASPDAIESWRDRTCDDETQA